MLYKIVPNVFLILTINQHCNVRGGTCSELYIKFWFYLWAIRFVKMSSYLSSAWSSIGSPINSLSPVTAGGCLWLSSSVKSLYATLAILANDRRWASQQAKETKPQRIINIRLTFPRWADTPLQKDDDIDPLPVFFCKHGSNNYSNNNFMSRQAR